MSHPQRSLSSPLGPNVAHGSSSSSHLRERGKTTIASSPYSNPASSVHSSGGSYFEASGAPSASSSSPVATPLSASSPSATPYSHLSPASPLSAGPSALGLHVSASGSRPPTPSAKSPYDAYPLDVAESPTRMSENNARRFQTPSHSRGPSLELHVRPFLPRPHLVLKRLR